MTRTQDSDYVFKLLVIGDERVGKSSIMSRFVDDVYSEDYTSTNGIDFKIKNIELEGKTVKLQIWDTWSQERHEHYQHRTIWPSIFRGVHGVILVYDLTNQESFENVKHRNQDYIIRYASENVARMLVGNKSDMARAVDYNTAKDLATKMNMPYLETSAKTSENVEAVFLNMVSEIKARVEMASDGVAGNGEPSIELNKSKGPAEQSSCLCS